jgi:CubicO group peptidase (beta-lactamase class C family)
MRKEVNSISVVGALLTIVLAGLFQSPTVAQVKTSLATTTERSRFELAADYSKDYRGLSLIVIKGDRVVFEQYDNGHSAESPHMLASGTKSFVGVMAMAAVEDKLLKLDERVSETITEWKADSRKSRITISQLLHLVSGLGGGTLGRPPAYADAIASTVDYEPGTKFQYGPTPFQVFGEVMRRKLLVKKEGPLEYLKRRILDPIGLKISFWQRGTDGNPHLPSGAFLESREWAKFGVFLKNGGKWNGKQIISKKLLDLCYVGSKVNPAYGLTFWLNAAGGESQDEDESGAQRVPETTRISRNGIYANGPGDLVMAAGAGQQRLYIIPSLDLVIVRQGRLSRFRDAEFLARILDGKTASGQVAVAQ